MMVNDACHFVTQISLCYVQDVMVDKNDLCDFICTVQFSKCVVEEKISPANLTVVHMHRDLQTTIKFVFLAIDDRNE